MKKFNLRLKEPHLEAITDIKARFSISDNNEIINKCIMSAINMKKNDIIFSDINEKCSGGCFASEPQFNIEMDEDIFNQLKIIYKEHDFDDYKTEEEEVSKVIRCIINFFENEPELITI